MATYKKFFLALFIVLSFTACPVIVEPIWWDNNEISTMKKLPMPYIRSNVPKLTKGAILQFECEVKGVDFYYTIDGTTPNRLSGKSSWYEVSQNRGDLTISVIAIKKGYLDSDVFSGKFVVSQEIVPTSISFDKSTLYFQKGEVATLKLDVVPAQTIDLVEITITENGKASFSLSFNNSNLRATKAGVYTITAAYGKSLSSTATVYVWEYKDILLPNPTGGVRIGQEGVNVSQETLTAGNGWSFFHSAGTTSSSGRNLRVFVDQANRLDNYFDCNGNRVGSVYGLFIDKIGGADFSASLLKTELLAAGFYALEGQYAGDAVLTTGDLLQFKMGETTYDIVEFVPSEKWEHSLSHVTPFYEVKTATNVEYGFALNTKRGSGVWGFAHSFKLRYIPKSN